MFSILFSMKRLFTAGLLVAATVTFMAGCNGPRNKTNTESAPGKPAQKYSESPILRAKVERGELPPVEERLPDEPLVVTPIESIGRYESDPKKPDSP